MWCKSGRRLIEVVQIIDRIGIGSRGDAGDDESLDHGSDVVLVLVGLVCYF